MLIRVPFKTQQAFSPVDVIHKACSLIDPKFVTALSPRAVIRTASFVLKCSLLIKDSCCALPVGEWQEVNGARWWTPAI